MDKRARFDEVGSSEKQSVSQESVSVELRKSAREKKVPIKLADSVVYVNFCSADPPESYEAANSDLRQQAMIKEIKNLERNGIWDEVSLSQGKKALDVK